MRDSRYQNSKKRYNDIVKSFKKIRIGRDVYGIYEPEDLKKLHKYNKHSFSCDCYICTANKFYNKKNKRKLEDKKYPIENIDEWNDSDIKDC